MKKTLYILLFILIGMNLTAQSVWDGKREAIRNGSGTESDPYLIENAQNLAWLVYVINWDYAMWTKDKYFLLTTDIDLNGSADNQWIPIGAGLGHAKYFQGTFDGGFHRITGLYINTDNDIHNNYSLWSSYAGFFSQLGSKVEIKNLYLEGSIITTRQTGGFSSNHGRFEYCIANIDIESTRMAAGIVAKGGGVKCSANLGNIKGGNCVGGIKGDNGGYNIENCYNTGRIEGANYVGGIVGYARSIHNCYNVGDIVCNDGNYAGGIIGRPLSSTNVTNCYYLESCIAESNGYGEPKSEEFMRSAEFVNLLNSDMTIWKMDTENTNNGYPIIDEDYLGVFENFVENTDFVVLYPNPATDCIHIIGDVTSYEIYDLVGKCVRKEYRQNVSTNMEEIRVNNLQSGIYMIRLFVQNGNFVTKKIVKR